MWLHPRLPSRCVSESPLVHYSTKGWSFFWLTTPGLKRTHPSPSTLSKSHTIKKKIVLGTPPPANVRLSWVLILLRGVWGVCAHTCAGGTHLPLAFQPSTMFEGESSAATLIGVEGFTAVRFDTKRRVCRVWALHARCSWLLIDCVTSHSSHRLDWFEEYVFKKPYLSCHEGKLTTAEDKAHETLGACSLNEQLKAAVNKVPHHRN